ncbi:MFS general substrate transporter [Rhodotorula diobovata]|uniref:MFS general substrate transporter n=1 Tax=Rhodotorula diobovata TaxID=5288 RepID=A0A5C5G2W9_9BASI|nr:MFS general substrate transporter [Rhodotorula diobovata]
MQDLGRTVSHGVVQHPLSPDEEQTFPQLTQAGSHTDAYLETSPSGLVLASEAEAPIASRSSHRHGSQSTLVSAAQHRKAPDPEKAARADDVKLVTWTPEDPENPRNFPRGKKWVQTLLPTLLCFMAGLSSSLITGGLPEMAEHYKVSEEVITLTVCVFVIGFGLGPLILSPLSEMYGRRIVYIVSVFLYFIWTLPECITDSVAVLVIFRFLAGCSIAGTMCNAAGSIGDVFDVNERGFPMALFSGILFIAPCLGPLLGGYITLGAGWRWMWWVLFIFGGVVWAFTSLTLVETYAPTLLKWRAQKLRKETGDESIMTEQERQGRPLAEIAHETLLRPLVMLATEPVMLCMSGYLCLVYGLLYAFFFAYPIVFMGHGFDAGQVGLCFLSILVGIAITSVTAVPLQERYYLRQVAKHNGHPPPEARLPLMMGCSVVLPVSLFIFASTSIPSVHWAGPLVSGIPFGFALVGIYTSANTYIAVTFSQYSASAMAAKTLARSLCGAGLTMFIVPMYRSIGNLWAGMTWAFISVAMLPIPFVFFFYGAQIRGRSAMASAS